MRGGEEIDFLTALMPGAGAVSLAPTIVSEACVDPSFGAMQLRMDEKIVGQ